ncbi:ribonuclease H-like domain-containing protein [Mycena maculata]|uniref:Ribonuclease H-like domain-containing protein n=1 Tax=Mycena maculata TaxID=230809 RepID=A0AAD7HZS4_9AGAR|nr:ribonuclease H-like domain-containing protein [Mycena maculata]
MADSHASSSSSLSSSLFPEFNSTVQAKALNATRSAAGLPADISFHRSMDPELAEDLDAFSSRVLSLTNNILALIATADPSQSNRRKGKGKLQSQDDVVDDFHSLVVDSMDQLLERTDMCLDEFLGRNKAPQVAINYDPRKPPKKNPTPRGQLDAAVQHASNLAKPQLAFKHPIINSDEPWYPALAHKFNAQVPLGHIYRDSDAEDIVNHPYRYEITHIAYPQRMFLPAEPIPPTPFESTSATWVATPDALDAMLDALRGAPEIAIDLEHNSYRSYAGIVCLMQISTRTQDWIVDTLALRAELATGALNEVFTDPAVVKVLHGAESDIVWLQQDFNLYIVNLFDTFHASKLLEFPRHGLVNLLEMYCDFVPDKRYQLADWRIRPLPEDMLQYARSDTHFLLFIYDNLRNALLDRAVSRAQSQSRSPSPPPPRSSAPPEQALIRQALARSQETALRVYEKEAYDTDRGGGSGGWDTLARKWNKGALVATAETPHGAETLQRAVYRCVHAWRDEAARADDESTRYVLPNHYLFQLAERPPADMAALLQMFPSVPPVVRRRAKELLEAIRACLQRYVKKAPDPPPPPPPVEKETRTEVDGDEAVVGAKVPVSGGADLWSIAPTRVAGKSALFGAALAAKAPAVALSATTSALFGTKGKGPSELTSRFQEVVARIHSALVIIPSMPVAQAEPAGAADPAEGTGEPAHGMQVEVPYVPAAQRATKHAAATVVDDSIVVVGQAKQKKRKRAKTEGDAAADEPAGAKKAARKEKAEAEEGAGEPFDFSAVPNILDDVPNGEDMRVKKKKKGKQGKEKEKSFYGDFPAPPKAHSDVKSGNQSHTFK